MKCHRPSSIVATILTAIECILVIFLVSLFISVANTKFMQMRVQIIIVQSWLMKIGGDF